MITSKGYKILLNHEKANEFRKELTIVPFLENSIKYPIYRISENYLYIPKYYGIKKLGLPEIIKEQEGEEVELNFSGKLRDYQQPIVDNIIKHLIKNQSGLASLYTGWGKTCAALYISSIIKRKTLIIVHTDNLLEQWKERIKEFLNEEIGIIKGPIIDIENKKIVVGMIQSISQKDYEKEKIMKKIHLKILD
jgi:superfamily II DNA or RNA helicase